MRHSILNTVVQALSRLTKPTLTVKYDVIFCVLSSAYMEKCLKCMTEEG